jgi:hypothetical protein
VAENFVEWCHLATILCGEIRMCLLHLVMERDLKVAADKMLKLAKKLDELPPEYKLLFEDQVRNLIKAETPKP